MKIWYWTTYWRQMAAQRKRRIRELEAAIREFRTVLEDYRFVNKECSSTQRLFEVLDK